MREGVNGVTDKTAKNILFGAGTIHKGLKYSGNSWNFKESIVGATNGGSKLSIVPELYNVPVDGANVTIKGLVKKIGETAVMEVNFAETTQELIQAATLGATGTSDDTKMNVINAKADIVDGDYWENIAFVGQTLEGKNIIAILENALVTSGFSTEGKNKESVSGAYTFTCHADNKGEVFDVLPWKIYYPKPTI